MFKPGDRVQLHQRTIRHMLGDKDGIVVSVGSKAVQVRMIRSRITCLVSPNDLENMSDEDIISNTNKSADSL